MFLQVSLFNLIAGNIPGARKSNDPVCGGDTLAAAVTRAQARKGTAIKPLIINDVLFKLPSPIKNYQDHIQQEEDSLKKYQDLKEAIKN